MNEKEILDILNSMFESTNKAISTYTDKYVETLMSGMPSDYYNQLSIKSSFKLKHLKSLIFHIEHRNEDESVIESTKSWYNETFLNGISRPLGLSDNSFIILIDAKEDLREELKFIIKQ